MFNQLIFSGISSLVAETPIKQQTKLAIMHCINFNQSFKSLEAFTSIINSTPGAQYRIPMTKHKIKKFIDPLFATKYHMKCNECKHYTATESSEVECKWCETHLFRSKSDYFTYFPFLPQLKKSILKHFNDIITYKSRFDQNSDVITDVQDGMQFKIAQRNYPEKIVLSLTVNTDGAQVFKSTTKSIWPIQLYLNFLPAKMRFLVENIIVVALHDGKPKMSDFFSHF